jgi:signal transduction histidine kinase
VKVRSLRLRLLAGAVAFLFLALGAAAVALTVLFERHVKTWIDAELAANVDLIIAGLDRASDGRIGLVRPPPDPRFSTPFSGYYWQVQTGGSNSAIRSPSLWDFSLTLPQLQTIEDHAHHHRVAGPQGQTLYLLEKRVELPARLGRETARVTVGIDEAKVDTAVWQFAKALSPFLLFLGSLLVAAAGIQVSLGLRPLKSVRDRITGIRSGQNRRLGGDFPEEILPLAREIDTLLDARERQIETARARAADLAHGLKTPIQVLIGGIAKLKSKGEGAIADDLEVATALMQRHVDRQLAKARVAANGINAAAPVAQICDQIAAVVRKTPEGERLHWSVAVPAGLQASIHPDDLAEALGGLVENAARHARSRVALSAHRNADEIAIRVSDDGPGIPEAELDEVMNRGRRLDTSEASSGLGLAIVADILEAWGGSVVFDRADGEFSAILNLRATA